MFLRQKKTCHPNWITGTKELRERPRNLSNKIKDKREEVPCSLWLLATIRLKILPYCVTLQLIHKVIGHPIFMKPSWVTGVRLGAGDKLHCLAFKGLISVSGYTYLSYYKWDIEIFSESTLPGRQLGVEAEGFHRVGYVWVTSWILSNKRGWWQAQAQATAWASLLEYYKFYKGPRDYIFGKFSLIKIIKLMDMKKNIKIKIYLEWEGRWWQLTKIRAGKHH